MRRLALLLLVFVLAGCGGGDEGPSASPGSDEDPATAIPAGLPVVLKVSADLDGDQWKSALAFADRVDNSDQDLRATLLDRLGSEDVDFEEDVKPWLGDTFALGIGGVEDGDIAGVLAVATSDEQATLDALAAGAGESTERTYEGATYTVEAGEDAANGVVDGFLIAANDEANFKAAVDALRGDSVADDEAYRDTVELAPDDTFATAYVQAQGLLDLLESSGAVPPETLAAIEETPGFDPSGSAIGSVVAEDDSMALELAGDAVPSAEGQDEAPALADLPGEAWLAAAAAVSGEAFAQGFQEGFEASGGAQASQVLAQTGLVDYFSRITSFALRVGGTSITGLNGQLSLGGGDADAALVGRIAKTVNRLAGGPVLQLQGAEATLNQPPFQLTLAAQEGDLNIRVGDAPEETLGDGDAFDGALEALDMDDAALFVDFAPLEELVRTVPSTSNIEEVLPTLAELGYLVAGFETDDDASRARVVLTLR